jgi:hypothetical protein
MLATFSKLVYLTELFVSSGSIYFKYIECILSTLYFMEEAKCLLLLCGFPFTFLINFINSSS